MQTSSPSPSQRRTGFLGKQWPLSLVYWSGENRCLGWPVTAGLLNSCHGDRTFSTAVYNNGCLLMQPPLFLHRIHMYRHTVTIHFPPIHPPTQLPGDWWSTESSGRERAVVPGEKLMFLMISEPTMSNHHMKTDWLLFLCQALEVASKDTEGMTILNHDKLFLKACSLNTIDGTYT